MDSSVKASGRLADILWAGMSSLLSASLTFSQLFFIGGTVIFFIYTPCCEATQASGYCHSWLRQAFSVSSSPTVPWRNWSQKGRSNFLKETIPSFSASARATFYKRRDRHTRSPLMCSLLLASSNVVLYFSSPESICIQCLPVKTQPHSTGSSMNELLLCLLSVSSRAWWTPNSSCSDACSFATLW